jgi:AraC-like DNA-binding protein
MKCRLVSIQDWEKLAREAKFQPAIMAALCPISLRQMQRFFVSTFEKTPRQWTRELRCRLALNLISQGWSTKAVSVELSFADGAHFCREFKRVYGHPPQSFAPLYGVRQNNPSASERLTAVAELRQDVISCRVHSTTSLTSNSSLLLKGACST